MHKRLIPDPDVLKRYGISAMTLWRWDQDASLGFPKPIRIRGRKYRDERELDAFDAAHREGHQAETAPRKPARAGSPPTVPKMVRGCRFRKRKGKLARNAY
jgi:predicted DNA-binding transcriptional regulator AlpA